LLHIVRELYPNVEAVFVDTGLEYPEIREFVKGFENVTWLRPKMRFDEVIKKYGYPVISKEVSQKIYEYRMKPNGVGNRQFDPNSEYLKKYGERFSLVKYIPLRDSNIPISHICCKVMKKNPTHEFEKQTGKKPVLGIMTQESALREESWLKSGCNAFNAKRPISNPLSFWTNQDILQYIHDNNIEIASVYGEVKDNNYLSGQMCIEGCETWKTTGCARTGCVFCLFGMHLEKGETRLQRLHRTHPKVYDYCMGGGEFVDGWWQPNKNGLGMKYVCDEVNRVMGKEILRY